MGSMRVIVALRHAFVTRLSEWQGAFILLLWGYVLLLPDETYAGANWSAFSLLIEEDNLGWLCMAGGLLRLGILAANGAYRPMYYLRAWMALTSGMVWFAIACGFYSSGNIGTWIAVYPVLFVFEVVNLFRAASDAAAAEILRITQERVDAQ